MREASYDLLNTDCLLEPNEYARRRLIEQRDRWMNATRTKDNQIPQDRSVRKSPDPHA